CVTCAMGKSHQEPVSKEPATRAKKVLERVHSDVCGPFHLSLSGARYYVTFIDDCSRFLAVNYMKAKSKVLQWFKEYFVWACNQQGTTVKWLQFDNGGEYVSKKFRAFLAEHGIQHEFTAPNSPFQNGVAERKNRDLQDIARCLLF